MITEDSLTARVLRSPYAAGAAKGPPETGILDHFGVDHRQVHTRVSIVLISSQRFPYTLPPACDEIGEKQ